MIAIAATGLLAGCVHVMSGPDHLAAVAPFAIRRRRAAWRAGMQWGLGHASGVGVVAVLGWAFREILPLERLSGWSERMVGVVLIALGVWAVRAALGGRVHVHEHEHDGVRHVHIHRHREGDHAAPGAHEHGHAVFGVGALHGLAGTSHLLGVLPALALPTHLDAFTYLLAYAVGSVAAMSGFALALGSASRRLSRLRALAGPRLLGAAGAAAIAVGAVWLFG